jgi:vacuolar iron transporter family protein
MLLSEGHMLSEKTTKFLIKLQKNEITEHFIYRSLAASMKDENNKKAIEHISTDELKHYNVWKGYTSKEIKPDRLKYFLYVLVGKIFGVTFAIKLMENGEANAQVVYNNLSKEVPEASKIMADEDAHEDALIAMVNEEKLKYIGSIVLGLNDALVELTGTLAGLTFALQNTKIIGVAGLITGIAAALSMGASEYLSTKSEEGTRDPVRASIYTTIVYICAVFFLVVPYLIVTHYLFALSLTLLAAITMIFIFTYYYSVVKDISFKERFIEMFSISMGVAALSFLIGLLVRQFLGINI